jgi:hypothetical protein
MTKRDQSGKILRVKSGVRAGCGEDTSTPPPPDGGGSTPTSSPATGKFTFLSRLRTFSFFFS